MKCLTVAETAEMLGISEGMVRGMLARLGAVDLTGGAGKYRCIRIPESGIRAYLNECRIRPATTAMRRGQTEVPFHIPRRRA